MVYRGANDLRIEEIPVPEIQSGELLVRVGVCGVCPTDIKKIQSGGVPPPRVFGHETAGVVVEVGRGLTGYVSGERVALHHHVPCMRCHACRHRHFAQCPVYKKTGITAGFEPAGGGFAEYVRVMPFVLPGVVKIPDGVTLEEGAMLEPVNTVLKGVDRLGVLPGDRVWVAGQGPVGLMFTRLLQLAGVEVVASDLLPERMRRAKEWGATEVLDAQAADFDLRLEALAGDGFDAAVLAVPVDALVGVAMARIRCGGRVLLFAHTRLGACTPVDLGGVCMLEKDLVGSYSADWTLQDRAAELVFGGRLRMRDLISHRFSLPEAPSAIAEASRPGAGTLKVVVTQEAGW